MSKEIAIVRPEEISANTLVISAEVVKAKDKLLKKADSFVTIDETNHKKASDCFSDIHETNKMFANNQKAATKPINDYKTAIIDMVKPHVTELTASKKTLGEKIHAYEVEVQRKADEERNAIEAENARIQAEYDAEQARLAEEAKAKGDFPEAPTEPIQEPVAVPVNVPVIKSKVVAKKHWKLTIENRFLIPKTILDENGSTYHLLVPDEVIIKNAFKAGLEVPGCTWKQESSVGA